MKPLLTASIALILALLAACGGGGSDPSATPSGTGVVGPTLSPLEASLASVLLQPADLPDGLEGGSPAFSTNDDIARGDPTQLATLAAVGRQLGADLQYIPTDRLDPASPVRGLQSSASVYVTDAGASQTFQETAEQASNSDWLATYPDIPDLTVKTLDEQVGDESLWIRLSGSAECTFISTPAPGSSPTPTCGETRLFIEDNLILRAGRVRAYIKVTSLFPPTTTDDPYVDEVKAWAELVVQRAQTAFPS